MPRYLVEVFADGNATAFAENAYGVELASTVGKIVSNCTRRVAGVSRIVVRVMQKDGRPAVGTEEDRRPASKGDEMILACPASVAGVAGLAGTKGIVFGAQDAVLGSREFVEGMRFVRRADAEVDERLKQPIPYWVVVDPRSRRILCFVRGKMSGEGRLTSKASVGFGGHVSLADVDESLWVSVGKANGAFTEESARMVYELGAVRELNEELDLMTPVESRIAAVINDDTEPVGRVHLGLVHVAVPSDPSKVFPRETMVVTDFGWKTTDEIEAIGDLEGWSRMCLSASTFLFEVADTIAARTVADGRQGNAPVAENKESC
jgi:predicted NUDIX family phosphoesterase